jgi:hypothetical protein
MTRRPLTNVGAALVVVGVAVAGCGHGGGDPEADPAEPTTTEPAIAAEPVDWEQVSPGGDCQCADGSEYHFFVRRADPDKVLLFLRAGGACWSAETCAQDGRDGTEEIITPAIGGDGPTEWDGILDLDDERNPFADHSIVFVPYCTGDVFLGDTATTYAPDLTVQHRGRANATAALDHLAATFPDADEVVVAGVSAGSVAAPLYGGLAADRLPDARVTVLADGSGGYPAEVGATVAGPWDVGATMPDWPGAADLTPEQWASPLALYVQAGRQHPDITFARHDYAEDDVQVLFNDLLGIGGGAGGVAAGMTANEAAIEAAGVPVASYTAPGADHGVLQYDTFFTEEVDGVPLVDWVADLVAGVPVDDVG